MKSITNLFFIAGAVALLAVGCKGKDKVANDPKAVVVAFFEKLSKKDIDGAAKYATKDSKGTLDMMKKALEAAEKMGDLAKGTDTDPTEAFKQVSFGEPKIDGDKATVPVTNEKEKSTKEIPLKKEDGAWKVDFSMSTLQKMKDKGGDTGFDAPTDTEEGVKDLDKLMNSDTLKGAVKEIEDAMKNIKPEDIEKMKEAIEKMKQN